MVTLTAFFSWTRRTRRATRRGKHMDHLPFLTVGFVMVSLSYKKQKKWGTWVVAEPFLLGTLCVWCTLATMAGKEILQMMKVPYFLLELWSIYISDKLRERLCATFVYSYVGWQCFPLNGWKWAKIFCHLMGERSDFSVHWSELSKADVYVGTRLAYSWQQIAVRTRWK